MSSAVLIGNDINALSPGYDWYSLLSGLVDYVGGKNSLPILKEQFPLFYEEIYAFACSKKSKSEGDIKKFIAREVKNIEPNYIHAQITDFGVRELLTTNYEFSLEKSTQTDTSTLKNNGIVAEKRYSLFRCFKSGSRRFWHLHGDALHPRSIALGYEHYSGYLQVMRNYMVAGTRDSYKSIQLKSLVERLKRNDFEVNSWLDLFFSHDIHIVGLGLDFVEIHLWWLLTYRARVLNGSKFPVSNKIFYYYPKGREQVDETKLRFLRACNVTLLACGRENSDKSDYYDHVLSTLSTELRA